jgi:hypothetical protein
MSVTLQAEYDDVEDNIVQWKEKIVYIGNCGPQFTDVQTFFGVITVRTALATPQRIIQSGTAIGWQGYVSPPGPYLPNLERPHVRRVELEGGQNMGLQARLYGTSWTYTMVATQPQTIFPATL